MYINLLLKLNSIGDLFIYQNFFNYSNYCYFSYFFSFYIEFFLFIYILYSIVFYKEKTILYKYIFYQYLFFLVLLLFSLFLVYIYNDFFSIISFHFINNIYSIFCKILVLILMVLILFISKNKLFSNPKEISFNELPCIFTFLILFICILLSTVDLFIMYLAIEGISLILYTLGSIMNQSLINIEAIIKYFLINNIASSFLLWSISYIYILIGTTDCFELQYFLMSSLEVLILEHLYYICFILILSFFFKLAIFPFQWWVADIYEGLWTPITLCYAVLIKVTFFLFFFKLVLNVFYPILFLFQPYLLIGALGSIVIGSLGALIQVKIKRFLAYTSIAQSGYIILGLSANSLAGAISSFLYLCMYCFITLSFFCIILNLEHINKGNNLAYLNQLYSIILYNKEISFHFIMIMLIMAAIPPFSSFFAKFFVLIVSIEAKWEFIICFVLLFSFISTFYYLNFIQHLIFLKFKEIKVYIFNDNFLFFLFLRFNSILLLVASFSLPLFYEFSLFTLRSCLWPLSY